MAAEYWRRIIKRAFAKTVAPGAYWRDHLGGGAVLSFLIGSLIFWSQQGWSGVTEQWDVWVVYSLGVGVLLFITAFLNNLYCVPAEMEREAVKRNDAKEAGLTERIEALEAERQQSLAFDFRAEDGKYFETVDAREGGHRRKFRVGRVAVKNESRLNSIRNVYTTLVNYTKDCDVNYNTVDILLSDYSSGNAVEDLPARRSHTYNIFRLKEAGNTPHISLGPRPDGSYKQIPTGRYKLKITSSGENIPPLVGFFLLDVKESGEVIYGPYHDESKHIILS